MFFLTWPVFWGWGGFCVYRVHFLTRGPGSFGMAPPGGSGSVKSNANAQSSVPVGASKSAVVSTISSSDVALKDSTKAKEAFRNYTDSERQATVERTYAEQHMKQTFEFVQKQKAKHLVFNKGKMSIWEAVEMLNEVIDDTDPDSALPQWVHLVQTANAMREKHPKEDWFHLVGLLHDLGRRYSAACGGLIAVVSNLIGLLCGFARRQDHESSQIR